MNQTWSGLLVLAMVGCGDDTAAGGEQTEGSTGSTAADTTTGVETTTSVETTSVETTSVETTSASPDSSSSDGESSSTGEPLGPPAACPSELQFLDESFDLDGGIPFGVALLDADGTGGLDMVVTDALGRVLVLAGVGDGTFDTPTELAFPDAQPQDLLVADFDGDAIDDVLVADMDGQSMTVRQMRGVGDGTFTPGPNALVGARPADLQLADFDGDGAQDFAVRVLEGVMPGNVRVTFGAGDGTFTASAEPGVAGQPVAFATGDLDGDGAPDLLGVHTETSEIVLRRNTDGAFADAGTLAHDAASNAAIIADLDHDGLGEIVVSSGADGMPGAIHLWQGSADFQYGEPLAIDADVPVDALLTHDVSGDGWPDLVLGSDASTSAPGLWIVLTDTDGLGACTFTVALEGSPRSIAAGDVDGDGDEDIVAALAGAGQTIAVLLQE